MAQTLPNILVDDLAWVDINSASGVTVGNQFTISNEWFGWVILHESPTSPLLSETSGCKLTPKSLPYSTATVVVGSDRIWAKAHSSDKTELLVQAL